MKLKAHRKQGIESCKCIQLGKMIYTESLSNQV